MAEQLDVREALLRLGDECFRMNHKAQIEQLQSDLRLLDSMRQQNLDAAAAAMQRAKQLSTYGELAEVIDSLPLLARERRRQTRQSVRSAAAEIGMSFSTLSRLENGADLNSDSLAAVLRWLDAPDSPSPAPSPVSAATEAHGEAEEA